MDLFLSRVSGLIMCTFSICHFWKCVEICIEIAVNFSLIRGDLDLQNNWLLFRNTAIFLHFFQIFFYVIQLCLNVILTQVLHISYGYPGYYVAILICAFSYFEWDFPLSYFLWSLLVCSKSPALNLNTLLTSN